MCGRFNEGVEIEPVSDFLAPPTLLFPLPAHSVSSGHASTGTGFAGRRSLFVSVTFCAPPS